MKNLLNIGSIKLPKESATKGFGFIGKRGSGKSYGAAVFAEELYKEKIPFVVFDPIDVWWGLKVGADGKGTGLPIVVFGKEHADIQLDRTMGKRIAEAVVRENISCVISTFGLNKTEMREIIADFSECLLRINNTPRQVIIEEAHEFVPQRVMGAGARCFSAVESLLVMGRNRGIGVTLLNQRMATLNKDLLTQIDVLVAFRSVGPQDRKAFSDWVEVHNVEGDEKFDEFMRSVPSLTTGHAWVWSPEFLEKFERVKFRARDTFHPDREKLGMTFKMPEIKQGDIQSFIDSFSKKPESKNTVQLRDIKSAGHTFSARKALDARDERLVKQDRVAEYKRGFEEGKIAGERNSVRKFDVLKNKLYQELLRSHGNVKIALDRLGILVSSLSDTDYAQVEHPTRMPIAIPKIPKVNVVMDRKIQNLEIGNDATLQGGALRMLRSLASRHPASLTRSQLATLSDVKLTGGSFRTYMSRLKMGGYVEISGDNISITTSGMEFIGPTEDFKTSDQVIAMWRNKLTGGARVMFDVLLGVYPEQMSKYELSAHSGIEITGGSFRTYLSRLKSNGLVDIAGNQVKTSDTLFMA